ncbi:unnamed protein product [Symbiodinium pilosum]|uniref:Uncharacterized protein n=1 Tax=Symbiodinium pilosum TaxID=2952 RepID=A0A812TAH3_SYMPI|nr:unnamed protein product [Symbiodinium pilosum]
MKSPLLLSGHPRGYLSPAGEEFLSRKGVSANCLISGWADDSQQAELRKTSEDCFTWNPVDTSQGVGGLQGSLGDATQCVLYNLNQKWGWQPELVGSGSNSGGPYDTYGAGTTVIGVDTPSGKWQFILKKPEGAGGGSGAGQVAVTVQSLHRGDATPEQETDILHFAQECFSKSDVDTSNLGNLQGSLGTNIGCVLQKCEDKWGWKPQNTQSGSLNAPPYDVYGLGATVIGVDSPAGHWQFVLRLKF